MKVTTIDYYDEINYGQDDSFELLVDDISKIYVRNLCECPEDATLGRDLNFVCRIPDLLQMAYDAGKSGEEFILEQKTGKK